MSLLPHYVDGKTETWRQKKKKKKAYSWGTQSRVQAEFQPQRLSSEPESYVHFMSRSTKKHSENWNNGMNEGV